MPPFKQDNPSKNTIWARNWRAKNPERDKELQRKSYLKNRVRRNEERRERYKNDKTFREKHGLSNKQTLYGITPQEYKDKLEKQKGVCAICKCGMGNRKTFCVDHNHETKQVRGLICIKCNSAIGLVNENINTLEAIINYLKEYNAIN